MITGRQAFNSLEQASAKVRADETRLDAALRSASEEAARLRQERLKEFRALAQLKFGLIKRGELVSELDAAEQQVKDLLDRRGHDVSEAAARREEAAVALRKAEAEARECATAYEAAVQELRALQDRIGPSVTGAPAWIALNECVDKADAVAGEAEKKATQAEADRERKKTPYEGDPLFMYLWRRKFGTSAYPSGFFVRYFDNKIAALINYRDARANYAMLNQIPDKLREHAILVGAELEAERQKLAAFEQERLVEAGGAPLQKQLAEAKAALDASESEVARAQHRHDTLDQQYDAIAGQDDHGVFGKAIDLMAENDSRDDVRTLYREAARTKTDEDRAIVERIDRLTQLIARADEEIVQVRGQIREVAARRVEIDDARREFRQRGYDYPGTAFGNETTINDVLGGIIQGAMKGIVLGQVLQQGYRRPPSSNWGGGMMPAPGPVFPPSRPFPGPSMSQPRGGGSDGFRTGGTF